MVPCAESFHAIVESINVAGWLAHTGLNGTLYSCLGMARWTVPVGNGLRKAQGRVLAFDAVGYAGLPCCVYRRAARMALVKYWIRVVVLHGWY